MAGRKTTSRELTKILGGVLASNSSEKDTLEKHLKLYGEIDFGCVVNKMAFSKRKLETSVETEMKYFEKEEAILAFFYIVLDELYDLGTVAGMDIREYANRS